MFPQEIAGVLRKKPDQNQRAQKNSRWNVQSVKQLFYLPAKGPFELLRHIPIISVFFHSNPPRSVELFHLPNRQPAHKCSFPIYLQQNSFAAGIVPAVTTAPQIFLLLYASYDMARQIEPMFSIILLYRHPPSFPQLLRILLHDLPMIQEKHPVE